MQILKLLLSEDVSLEEFSNWLAYDEKTVTPAALTEFDSIKSMFVPFFLNYLRERTLQLVQSSHSEPVNNLTPNKTPKQSASAPKRTPQPPPTVSSRRVRLFSPDRPDKDNSCFKLNISVDESTPYKSTSTNAEQNTTTTKFITPIKKSGNSFHKKEPHTLLPLESTPRHKQKISFGQYISSTKPSKPKHHSFHGDQYVPESENRKSRNRQNKSDLSNASSQKNYAKTIDISDTLDFPSLGAASINLSKKQSTKRIKPTLITAEINSNVSTVNSNFSNQKGKLNFSRNNAEKVNNVAFEGNVLETHDAKTLSEERELLKKEKMKWSQSKDVPADNECRTPVKVKRSLIYPSKSSHISAANPDKVTHSSELSLLSDIYSLLIRYNFVPNISVELYFILQLLTLRYDSESEDIVYQTDLIELEDINFFSTIHNCIAFATMVLDNQISLVECLDVGLIKAISEMPQIFIFSPSLQSKLQQFIYSEKKKSLDVSIIDKNCNSSVSFQVETDNRNNFLTDTSFRTFRKQRDAFYEIIRTWEGNHMNCGWTLAEHLSGKIRSAVSMRMDPVSYSHFARLFVAQLILMCKGPGLSDPEKQNDVNQALSCLIKADPEKLKKLQQRLVKPAHAGGICPVPSFPGHEEFFKDFILVAQSPYFIQHLIDHLIFQICQFNDMQFSIPEEQNNGEAFEDIQEQYFVCMQTLRLLGKFLGFIVFLPYRTSQNITEYISSSETSIRSKLMPPIDLLGLLTDSVIRQRKVLVIPWIVEFLSMIDSVAPSTTYYQNLLSFLVFIYRMPLSSAPTHSTLLIQMLLGWLFQSSNFPEFLLFRDSSELMVHKPFLPTNTENHNSEVKLDELNVVDQVVLYSCCSFLDELKSLVNEFFNGNVSTGSKDVRKITPLTNIEKSNSSKHELLQIRLEETFFQNQPASFKKTVDFVAERVASNAIKNIRRKIVPAILKTCCDQVKSSVANYESAEKIKLVKNILKEEINVKATTATRDAEREIFEFAPNDIEEQAWKILSMLLIDDTSEHVLKTSCKIISRIGMDKVRGWSAKYVTFDYFLKELTLEGDKEWKQKLLNKSISIKDSFNLSCSGKHSDQFLPPSILMSNMKHFAKRLNNAVCVKHVHIEELLSVIDAFRDIEANREDVTVVVIKTLCYLLSDIVTSIVCFHSDLWNDDLEQSIRNLWSTPSFNSNESYKPSIISIISSKSLFMLQNSNTLEKSRKLFTVVVSILIDKGLIDVKELSDRISTFMKIEWPQVIITMLSDLLKSHPKSDDKLSINNRKIDQILTL